MTVPVGSFVPNPFGLYDTVGNVREWTCSEYVNPYQGQEQSCANHVSDDSPLVVVRGGWRNDPWGIRAANRDVEEVSYHSTHLGFRLVRR